MNALENEKKRNNAIEYEFENHQYDERPKKQKAVKRNYSIKRDEAVNGTVQPIKDVKDIQRISESFWIKQQYRNWCLFNVGCCVGLRASDLLRLKVSDFAAVDMDGNLVVNYKSKVRIKEKKTKKYREFPMPKSAMKVIDTYVKIAGLGYNDWLFPSRQGSWENSLRTNGGTTVSESGVFRKYDACPKNMGDPLDVDSFGRIMRQVQHDLNLPYKIGTHSCRKTFGYQYMMRNQHDAMALSTLQDMLNHSSQTATLHYIGLDDEVRDLYFSQIDYGVDTHSENEE